MGTFGGLSSVAGKGRLQTAKTKESWNDEEQVDTTNITSILLEVQLEIV
jgi:hypothetical protein